MGQEDHKTNTLEEALAQLSSREQGWGVEQEDDRSSGQELLPVLRFHNITHHYALPGDQVKEVIGPSRMTPLPGAPPYILGITVHRRQVIGILDLDQFFYPERSLPSPPPERVILVEYGSSLVGIHAGERTYLEQWPLESVSRESVELLQPNIRPYARAIRDSPQDPDVVLLLDIDKVLEDAAIRG